MLGVLADDRSNTLFVNQNATDARGGAPASGQTALRTFDLKTGAAKGTYPFPANSRICNDIAVAEDGTAYVSESYGGKVHRLKPGATALQTEQAGRVAELTITGDRAEVRVLREGLSRASGVTRIGDTLVVLVEFARAVVVPYAER